MLLATMANARYQTNGVDVLIDAITASKEDPADIRDRMWAVAWARGYQDVMIPIPTPDLRVDGYVVLAREFAKGEVLVIIDDGERLVGILERMEMPPLGARVRVVPTYGVEATWSLRVVAALGCGLMVRFDDTNARAIDAGWIDRLRACLSHVREAEIAVRRSIDAQRRTLHFVAAPGSFRVEMEKADKELRESVLSSGYTEDEKRALARAKTGEAQQKVIASRNKRLVEAYRHEVVRFREQIPELRAEYDRKMDEYAAFRNAIDHFNDVDASSRTVTETSMRATANLDIIEQSGLNVRVVDLSAVESDPRARFAEIVATIELLFELIPKRLQQRLVSSAASAAT